MKKSVKLASFAAVFAGTCAFYSLPGHAVMADAEGEETSSIEAASESGETLSEASSKGIGSESSEASSKDAEYEERLKELEDKVAGAKDWANSKWDTYVAPLLGGVSLAVVVSFIGTLAISYAKGKGLDKKLTQSTDNLNSRLAESKKELDEKLVLVEERMAQASEALDKVGKTLETLNAIKESVESGERISEETQAQLKSDVASLEKEMLEMADDVGSLDDVKKAMVALAQIISAIASASDEAIKSGAASEVKRLANMTKEL